MALDFPASPVNGQTYGDYYYDSSIGAWRNLGSKNALSSAVTALQAGAYTKTNIKGTVTQSGGVPTGALIESGANYVRYADGTQITWGYITGFGALAGNASSITFTYAAAFSAAPAINVSPRDIAGASMAFWAHEQQITTSQATIYKITGSPFANTNYGSAFVTCIGRWY